MTVSNDPSVDTPTDPPKRRVGRPPTLDRAAALEAAQRVIARRGVDRTRYSDIAEESGVPVSTLQHAFGTLQALVLTAVTDATSGEFSRLRELSEREGGTPWARMKLLMSASIDAPEDAPDDPQSWLIWSELWRLAARAEDIGSQVETIYEEWWQHLALLVAEGRDSGQFDSPITNDPRSAAMSILALVDGLGVALCMRADGPDPIRAELVLLDALRSLLGVQDEG